MWSDEDVLDVWYVFVSDHDFRYVTVFVYPITATICDFPDDGGHTDEEFDSMCHACFKPVVL